MATRPDPKTRISGDEHWDGWWKFPAALILVTLVLIVAASIITGTGENGFTSGAAGQGSATSGQTSGP